MVPVASISSLFELSAGVDSSIQIMITYAVVRYLFSPPRHLRIVRKLATYGDNFDLKPLDKKRVATLYFDTTATKEVIKTVLAENACTVISVELREREEEDNE